jgi:phosphohistidine phosphatase
MKTLYIVRHAKSSWPLGVADFDRPLNDRGKRDAPEMAERLYKRDDKIKLFVSSPAKRALTTCKLFCEQFGISEKKIRQIDNLYHASVPAFFDVVEGFDEDFKKAVIFSHNPGITEFVNTLCPQFKLDNMPTCAIFAVHADTDKWSEFRISEKKFLFFDFPKNADKD